MEEKYIKQLIEKENVFVQSPKAIHQDVIKQLLENREDVAAHMNGKQPKFIDKHYVEDANQQAYRKQVYRSLIKPMLVSAMDNVYKILESSEFSIKYDDTVKEALSITNLLGETVSDDLQKHVFEVLFPQRVEDPNAVLAVVPILDEAKLELLRINLELFPCENVVLYESELVILNDGKDRYKVYTKKNYAEYYIKDGDLVYDWGYPHENNNIGCTRLGGVATCLYIKEENSIAEIPTKKPYKVLLSDFDYAVSLMDKLAQIDSQLSVVILSHVFPKWAQYAFECSECKGAGSYIEYVEDELGEEMPKTHVCPSCNGSKVLKLGAQDAIVIPYKEQSLIDDIKPERLLPSQTAAYITPEVASAQLLKEERDNLIDKLSQMLQINTTQEKDQSGYAKELDLNAQHTRIKKMAIGIKALIESTLKSILAFYIQNYARVNNGKDNIYKNALSSINVSMPLRIDLETLGDKEASYFSNFKNMTLDERRDGRLGILLKRNASALELKKFNVACLYTNLYCLYQVDELSQMTTITKEIELKSRAIFGVICNIQEDYKRKSQEQLLIDMPYEKWVELIDAKFEPLLQQIKDIPEAFATTFDIQTTTDTDDTVEETITTNE
jgi:hypothetical protein